MFPGQFHISRHIPRSIWALGLVSLFMDTSSELIHSLLPIFMVSTLGTSMISVGIVEGIAEATALISKLFSGTLSDYFGKRKLLTAIGYGLAALTKPLFPLAHTVEMVLSARFLDRVGKGIRGTPRDALIGDIAPPEIRGACFGLRQSLDTVGAFLGPLLAIFGMLLWSDNIRAVLWLAVAPAMMAFIIVIWGVHEPKKHLSNATTKTPFRIRNIRAIGSAYWETVIIASIFTLGRFSDAFLILKAQNVGLSIAYVPVVMVVMNMVYAFAAYPAGILSDRVSRRNVLLFGLSLLIVADCVLGVAHNTWLLMLGVSFWGLHMGFTQGLFTTLITDVTPAELRGTAYGIYNLMCGFAMLMASILAGYLWDHFGPSFTFFTGAGFTAIAMVGLLIKNLSIVIFSHVNPMDQAHKHSALLCLVKRGY